MSEKINITKKGWLKDNDGDKFAPKTLDELIYRLNENGTYSSYKEYIEEILNQKVSWGEESNATAEKQGLMSFADKAKLDNMNIKFLFNEEYNNLKENDQLLDNTLYVVLDGENLDDRYAARNISFYPGTSGISASNVQDAIDILAGKVEDNAKIDEIEQRVSQNESDIDKIEKAFQDGCETLVDKCATYDITPTSNSPVDISAAIDKVYSKGYTSAKDRFLDGTTIVNWIQAENNDNVFIKNGKTGNRWTWINDLGDCYLMIYISNSKKIWEGASMLTVYKDNTKIFSHDIYSTTKCGISIKKDQTLRIYFNDGNTIVTDCIIIAYGFNGSKDIGTHI